MRAFHSKHSFIFYFLLLLNNEAGDDVCVLDPLPLILATFWMLGSFESAGAVAVADPSNFRNYQDARFKVFRDIADNIIAYPNPVPGMNGALCFQQITLLLINFFSQIMGLSESALNDLHIGMI